MNTEKDHDLLIKLNTLVEQILDKLDRLERNSDTRITKAETRIDALEKINDQQNIATRLPKLESEVETMKLWVRDFDTKWKTIVGVASVVGSVAGFVMSQLLKVILP